MAKIQPASPPISREEFLAHLTSGDFPKQPHDTYQYLGIRHWLDQKDSYTDSYDTLITSAKNYFQSNPRTRVRYLPKIIQNTSLLFDEDWMLTYDINKMRFRDIFQLNRHTYKSLEDYGLEFLQNGWIGLVFENSEVVAKFLCQPNTDALDGYNSANNFSLPVYHEGIQYRVQFAPYETPVRLDINKHAAFCLDVVKMYICPDRMLRTADEIAVWLRVSKRHASRIVEQNPDQYKLMDPANPWTLGWRP